LQTDEIDLLPARVLANDRFPISHVRGLNIRLFGQIGDGADQFDALRTMIGAGTQLHLLRGIFHQISADLTSRQN